MTLTFFLKGLDHGQNQHPVTNIFGKHVDLSALNYDLDPCHEGYCHI